MKITQTPYIDYSDLNRIWLDTDVHFHSIRLEMSGWTEEKDVSHSGMRIEMRIPRVNKETLLHVTAFDDEGARHSAMTLLRPVKEWKVGFMLSSHEDLGYEDYANRLGRGCSLLTGIALDIMDCYPEYKYFIEHEHWLHDVEVYGGEAQVKRLKARIAEGRVDVGFPHSGVHTHWHGVEQLARSTYYAKRYAVKFGIQPKTALFADISGVNWAAIGAYAQAGVKYVINAHNLFRDHDAPYPIPPLFWWQAPNGKDRVLFWTQLFYRDYFFAKGRCLVMPGEDHVGLPNTQGFSAQEKMKQCEERLASLDLTELENSIVERLNGLSSFTWDVLPVSFYMDRELPPMIPLAFCKKMSQKWKWPRFELRTPTECMQELAERFGDTLPVFSGDIADQWSDAIAASPEAALRKRRAERLFPIAETAAAMTENWDRQACVEMKDAMDRLCSFDEHCWATEIRNPLEEHRYNLQYVKEQGARVAEHEIEGLLNRCLHGTDGDYVTLLSQRPVPYEGPVRMNEEVSHGKGIAGVEMQRLFDGSVLTGLVKLPALGVRSYQLGTGASEGSFAQTEEGFIRTALYEARYNPKNGRLCSLILRKDGRELLDAECPDALGDFLFLENENKVSEKAVLNRAQTCEVTVENGPLAVSLIRKEYEAESRAKIYTVITFYRDLPQIDVDLRFEEATGAMLGNHADRYRKNIFYAFPFAAKNPRFLTEMATGWIDEEQDRLPFRTQDFSVAKDAIRVESGDGNGVMLYSRDMPLFHAGGIHYQQFSRQATLESSHVYLYAASNRCAQLTQHKAEECHGSYHLSVVPYTKDEQNSLTRICDQLSLVPMAFQGAKAEASWLSLKAPDSVSLTALKPAEDGNGYVLRVRECGGAACEVEVTPGFKVKSACLTDIAEEDLNHPVCCENGKVIFRAEANAYTTVRLMTDCDVSAKGEYHPDEVQNIFAYEAHNGEYIVCWEKDSLLRTGRYDVLCDGRLLCSCESEPDLAQYVHTGVFESGDCFDVKYHE